MNNYEYSQGVCADGSAILRDGEMMTIEDIVETLNHQQQEINDLKYHKQYILELVISCGFESTTDMLVKFRKIRELLP